MFAAPAHTTTWTASPSLKRFAEIGFRVIVLVPAQERTIPSSDSYIQLGSFGMEWGSYATAGFV